MPSRGFFYELSDQLENNANVHRGLIAQIERKTRRNLVCYVANPAHPGGAMQDIDPDLLENVLRSVKLDQYGRRLDLLVSSPGGFPYAAEKMVKVCETFAEGFRTIVISRAMSAATLVCLGSQELVMSETASLGPINPQIVKGGRHGQRLVPAQVIIESFKEMLGAAQEAIKAKQPPDPFLHVLDSLDVTAVFESMKANDATKSIGRELLKRGLLRETPEEVGSVVERLVSEGEKELHQKHLYPTVLQQEIGLPITVLAAGSDLDIRLRELFVRIESYANAKGIAKCVATRQGSIDVQIEKMRR